MAKQVHRGAVPIASAFVEEINALRADLIALKTAFDGHVHGGITAGAANTSAVAASPAQTAVGLVEG